MKTASHAARARRRIRWACTACCLLSPFALAAQENADGSIADLRREIAAIRQAYEERIAALEQRVAEMETERQARGPATPTPAPEAPPSQPAVATAPPAPTSTYFNPSISMIGHLLAVAGSNHVESLPAADLRESELGLQAIVDPYARADFFLSFGEEGVEIEEGFATFTSLPAGFLVKAGRMRTAFGKVNGLHLDTLPWIDEPLPVANLLGSEEGWIGTGVSIARLFPVGNVFTEGTLEVFRGEAEGLFAGEERSDLAYNGHYRVFMDLTEASNLDLGLSYGLGPNGTEKGAGTRLEGLDLTYRWKPLQTGSYRAATFRGEVYRSRREQPEGEVEALGWYASGDYRLARRWFVGARWEAAEHADDDALRDTGEAATLTFWPSEFSQLRAQLRRRHYALTDETANELLLQLQFAIGAHGAHPF